MLKDIHSQWSEQRIAIPGRNVFLPYYTTSPWSEGGDFFVCFSATEDYSEVYLHCYSPEKRDFTAVFSLKLWSGRPAPVVSEELLCSVWLPARRTLLLPRGNELYAVPLDGEPRIVYRHNDASMRIGGPGTRSDDGKLAAFGVYFPVAGTPDRNELIVLDTWDFRLAGGHDFSAFHANHFQFMADSDFLLYAHEGTTEIIPDRVNRVNWKTGETKLLHAHETGEYIGHEMTAGPTVCAVRYPVSAMGGALLALDADGGNFTVVDRDDYWHCAVDPSGNIFTMDTAWWGNTKRKTEHESDIIRIDREGGTKEIVKTIRATTLGQIRHPHPQSDATGRRILFIEDSGDFGSITLMEEK